MKKTRLILAISAIVLIFGGILISDALGFWKTAGTKEPRKIENGSFKGEYDPWDIRGSYTFGNVEDAFNINSSILAKAFGVKDDNPYDYQIKNLEAMYEDAGFPVEIGTGSVRYFTALYNGLPLDGNEGLTKQAVNILYENNKIDENMYTQLLATAIDLSGTYEKPDSEKDTSTVTDEEEHGSTTAVTGSTTVGQALDMGIPETILAEYVGDTKNRDAIIKDLAQGLGLSFGEVRTTLNEYIPSD